MKSKEHRTAMTDDNYIATVLEAAGHTEAAAIARAASPRAPTEPPAKAEPSAAPAPPTGEEQALAEGRAMLNQMRAAGIIPTEGQAA